MRSLDMGLEALTGRRTDVTVKGVVTGDASWVSSETVMAAAKAFDSDLLNLVNDVNNNDVFTYRQYTDTLPEDDAPKGTGVLKKVSKGAPPPKVKVNLTQPEKDEHQVWVSQLSALLYDWWGDSEGEGSTFWQAKAAEGRKTAGGLYVGSDNDVLEAMYAKNPDGLGAYKALEIKNGKSLSTLGAAELAVVQQFRSRLEQLRDAYTKMGYKLHSTMSKWQGPPPSLADALITAAKYVSGAIIVGGVVYLAARFVPSFSSSPKPTTPAPTGA